MSDILNIEILEDGTLKTTTDRISMANHIAADGFLREAARACGGVTKQSRRMDMKYDLKSHKTVQNHLADGHTHSHGGHSHTHSHGGHSHSDLTNFNS